MRSGNLRFFLVDIEMRAVVDELLSRPDMVVYREPWHKQPLTLLSRSDELTFRAGEGELPETLFIAAGALTDEALAETPRPGTRYGLVSLDLPGCDGRTLLLGSLGFKADAGEAAKRGSRIFAGVRKLIRERAPLAVLARSRLDGAQGPARAVVASENARSFVTGGGSLKQRGVLNIEYLVPT